MHLTRKTPKTSLCVVTFVLLTIPFYFFRSTGARPTALGNAPQRTDFLGGTDSIEFSEPSTNLGYVPLGTEVQQQIEFRNTSCSDLGDTPPC